MSELDDFLNSLDVNTETSTEIPESEEPQTNSLSEEDFNDILSDMGFEEAPEVESEEAEEEEYNGNVGEGRDLDAEEDADWNERMESMERHLRLRGVEAETQEESVHFHMSNGEVVDAPIEHETTVSEGSHEESELLIQPNSPTLLLDESTSRFSGTEWYNEIKKQRIILAGCGGIGSWTALQLARMSPEAIFLYDDDIVEVANMSGQLYGGEDIGIAKVDAISRTLHTYTTAQNIYALNQKFTADTEAGDIMICGFDNMKARKIFFDAWVKHIESKSEEERAKCLFIDGRLSIDCLQVFCIRGDDIFNIVKYSREKLFSDEEADATVCSMKQTTYLACMIGSFIVNLFTNHVANFLNPIIPYDLPFFTEYDSQNMIFKTEN